MRQKGGGNKVRMILAACCCCSNSYHLAYFTGMLLLHAAALTLTILALTLTSTSMPPKALWGMVLVWCVCSVGSVCVQCLHSASMLLIHLTIIQSPHVVYNNSLWVFGIVVSHLCCFKLEICLPKRKILEPH